MLLDAAMALTLAAQCAPLVAPATMLAVSQAESGLDPLAIGVNGSAKPGPRARTAAEAAAAASRLLGAGANIDLGLAQINSANLGRLGLTVATAFDACRNLRASAQLLADAYAREWRGPADSQPALRRALSIYNTGDPSRGFRNGYVARVEAAALSPGRAVPALASASDAAPALPRPAWAVFGGARAASFVISPSPVSLGALP